MQCAAAAAVESGCAAEDFGHRAVGIATASDDVAMIAVGGADQVLLTQHFQNGAAGRLLADIDMVMADELALFIEINYGLFEMAYHQHAFEDRQAGSAIEGFGCH